MENQLPSRWTALDRARHDVESGRLWKARDRLNGYIGIGSSTKRERDDAIELLADVYFAMGDLPQAGKLWYLTDRDDEQARVAIEAWRARCGNQPGVMARSLVSHVPSTRLARDRYRELRQQAGSEGRRRDEEWNEVPRTIGDRIWTSVILGTVLVLSVGVWIVGIISIIWFLAR